MVIPKRLLVCICCCLASAPAAQACDWNLARTYEQKARDAGADYQRKALYFRKALGVCPKSTDSYAELSDALLKINEIDEAELVIKQGVDMDPRNSKIRRIYGDVLRKQGEPAAAVGQYERALRYARIPRHRFFALAHMGWVQHELGRHTQSTRYWEQALDIGINFEPFKDRGMYNMVAWNYAVCRTADVCDGAAAVAHHGKIPGGNQTWYELGTGAAAYARSGEFAAALKLQEQSIQLIRDGDMPDKDERLAGANHRMALYRQGMPYTDN